MACTATVTKSVRDEVITLLDMKGCEVVSTSPDRPNIYYGVKPRTEITLDMLPLLNSLKEHKKQCSTCHCVLPFIKHLCRPLRYFPF